MALHRKYPGTTSSTAHVLLVFSDSHRLLVARLDDLRVMQRVVLTVAVDSGELLAVHVGIDPLQLEHRRQVERDVVDILRDLERATEEGAEEHPIERKAVAPH